jgi:flagellar biosynthesis/type III secretory pathway chaperone
MTKAEKKRLIDVLDLWIESCESFYNTFKNDFVKRADAVNELIARCDKVHFINEFLEEGRFISTDKYLEIVDRYEKVLDGLDEVLKNKVK